MTFPARNSLAKSHFTPDTTETGVVGSKPDPLLKGRSAQTPPAEWAPFDQASGRGSCWGSSKPGSAARPPGRPPGRGVSLEAWRRGSRRRIPPRARRPRLRPHIAMRNSRSGRSACRARLVGTLSPLLRLPAVRAQPSRNPAVPSTRQFGRHAKRVLEQAGARPRSLIVGSGPTASAAAARRNCRTAD